MSEEHHTNRAKNRSLKHLRTLAKSLRSSRKIFSPSQDLSLASENPRFKNRGSGRKSKKADTLRSQQKHKSSRQQFSLYDIRKTMSDTMSVQSEATPVSEYTVAKKKGEISPDKQVELALQARRKAVRKRGEFMFGPSVAMAAHHESSKAKQKEGKPPTRIFRKFVPAFGKQGTTRLGRATKPAKVVKMITAESTITKTASKKTTAETEFIVKCLRTVVIFNHLSLTILERLADSMQERSYTAGSVVCKQGDFGEEMFVVHSGSLSVFKEEVPKQGEAAKEPEPSFALGVGSPFGELGMNYGTPRERTIKSDSEVRLFVLSRTAYGRIVENDYLRRNELMYEALSKMKILDKLLPEQLKNLIDFAEVVSMPAGKTIIEKGSLGGTFYMIVSGKVQCIVFEQETSNRTFSKSVAPMSNDLFGDGQSVVLLDEQDMNSEEVADEIKSLTQEKKRQRRKVYEFGPGEYFGERALLQHDFVRKADVIAKDDVELLAITYDTLSEHLEGLVGAFEENIRRQALEDTPFFDNLTKEEVLELQKALSIEKYSDGKMILDEGAYNDRFFIVRDGQVEVRKKLNADSADNFELASLGMESYFGEGSLLMDKKTTASVIAKGDVTCYVLNKLDFDKLVKQEKVEMLKRTFNERHRRAMVQSREKKNEYLASVSLDELQTLSTLGSGCFGLVKLVGVEKMRSFFALKILEKGTVVRNNQELNVLNEKKILLESDHPFIVKLYRTFKDRRYLYLLMEFIQGGEMFQFLHHERNGYLDNVTARFYVACVVDAFDYLHKKRIVYRDLKPENLMIDLDGYAKVVDFGFAKKLLYKTFTLCGTAQYLAPEILLNRGYGRTVDFWTLGILIYELFTGTTPFKRRDRNEQFKAIKQENKIRFNRRWKEADAAKQMVCALLHKHPQKRLGCTSNHRGFKEIKQHKWFDPIDFDKLYFKELTPPWLPEVKNSHDFSHFEEYDEDDNPLTGRYDDRAGNSDTWREF